MIGREKEKCLIAQSLESGRPEFMVVYGRRRVGKTYLIKEYFKERFSFYATGVADVKTKDQLKAFNRSLQEYGCEKKQIPEDWFEAFARLKNVLEKDDVIRDSVSGRRVVFLDELPWMDTARSDFKAALDYFWNGWASSQKDLILIVCGSATSWIINNLLASRGGFYNRITRQIHLMPFDLYECEMLIKDNNLVMTRNQIIDAYMVFGGIPYYYNLMDTRLSLAQNIDELVYQKNGQLHCEFQMLFHSLFKKATKHYAIIDAMAQKKTGVTRVELSKIPEVGDGEPLTKTLLELEQCGFIRKYQDYTKKKSGYIYQVIDPFILFYMRNKREEKIISWSGFIGSPSYYAWRGNAFEILCLNHVSQLKEALGISGVDSIEYSWKSKATGQGAQIDLLIDRKDGVINICEMKYTDKELVIDSDMYSGFINKINSFRTEVNPDKALHLTLVSVSGIKRNEYYNVIQNSIIGDDLFVRGR